MYVWMVASVKIFTKGLCHSWKHLLSKSISDLQSPQEPSIDKFLFFLSCNSTTLWSIRNQLILPYSYHPVTDLDSLGLYGWLEVSMCGDSWLLLQCQERIFLYPPKISLCLSSESLTIVILLHNTQAQLQSLVAWCTHRETWQYWDVLKLP